jgi:hypothetical protein
MDPWLGHCRRMGRIASQQGDPGGSRPILRSGRRCASSFWSHLRQGGLPNDLRQRRISARQDLYPWRGHMDLLLTLHSIRRPDRERSTRRHRRWIAGQSERSCRRDWDCMGCLRRTRGHWWTPRQRHMRRSDLRMGSSYRKGCLDWLCRRNRSTTWDRTDCRRFGRRTELPAWERTGLRRNLGPRRALLRRPPARAREAL